MPPCLSGVDMKQPLTEFETELELLIRRHLGSPVCNEDYQAVYSALEDAAKEIALEADEYPSKDDPTWTGRRGRNASMR
jgi:hypothetical protein